MSDSYEIDRQDESENDLGEYVDLITVTDEDGVEHTFEELDRIETEDGQHYVALVEDFSGSDDPDAILNSPAELLILRVVEIEGKEDSIDCYLEEIDDDDEYEDISAIFRERLGDYYDIEDDE